MSSEVETSLANAWTDANNNQSFFAKLVLSEAERLRMTETVS
jgi:hypothetical protein